MTEATSMDAEKTDKAQVTELSHKLSSNGKDSKEGKGAKKGTVEPGAVTPFMRFAIYFSFVMNAILLLVVVVLVALIFQIRNLIGVPLIGGLYDSFIQMDQATIIANVPVDDTIMVNDTVPVNFDLPLQTATMVELAEDAPIDGATIYLNGQPVPLSLVLRKGTKLNMNLNLIVPVRQNLPIQLKVPVKLNVAVNIPLKDTELHQPFANLANIIGPYDAMLDATPTDWTDIPRWISQPR